MYVKKYKLNSALKQNNKVKYKNKKNKKQQCNVFLNKQINCKTL